MRYSLDSNYDTQREEDFMRFVDDVMEHIHDYTISQYGDRGEDPVTDYTAEDCIKQVQKYCNRFGKNARSGQEKLDLLKAAHYIQMAYDKLVES